MYRTLKKQRLVFFESSYNPHIAELLKSQRPPKKPFGSSFRCHCTHLDGRHVRSADYFSSCRTNQCPRRETITASASSLFWRGSQRAVYEGLYIHIYICLRTRSRHIYRISRINSRAGGQRFRNNNRLADWQFVYIEPRCHRRLDCLDVRAFKCERDTVRGADSGVIEIPPVYVYAVYNEMFIYSWMCEILFIIYIRIDILPTSAYNRFYINICVYDRRTLKKVHVPNLNTI